MKKYMIQGLIGSLLFISFFFSCKSEFSQEGGTRSNQPPLAVAGPDAVITLPTDSVLLDGSKSSDPDGRISAWQWAKISGPASFTLANPTAEKTIAKNLKTGTYQFELKVTDDKGAFAKDTVMVMVDSVATANHPPIANAGQDQTITLPKDSALLDGTASKDIDGTIVSYKWIKIAGPASSFIFQSDSAKTIVKSLTAGVYQFELMVTDNGGLFAKDTVQIMVDNPAVNQPPVACAGSDQVITLPTNSVTLNGSCSTDPDNNITAYLWTKIAGPSSFTIANASAATTQVNNLTEGIYQFELKVTDAGGLSSKDTVQVTVNAPPITCGSSNRPTINVQLVAVGTLPNGAGNAVASVNNKLVFLNGRIVGFYDILTQAWSTGQLSEEREAICVVVAGNKVFFAGGQTGDEATAQLYSTVDVYDGAADTWSVARLSEPKAFVSAAALGNKVFFAGGVNNTGTFSNSWRIKNTDRVEAYDLSTNTWSVVHVIDARNTITAVTANNKIYFGGGVGDGGASFLNTIDIFDNVANAWSKTNLTEGKYRLGGMAVGDNAYWAGGITMPNPSCKVEMTNGNNQNTAIGNLFEPKAFVEHNAVLKDNKIAFFTGETQFDIFDVATNTWSIGVLPFKTGSSIFTINNIMYVAGSSASGDNRVYKLQF